MMDAWHVCLLMPNTWGDIRNTFRLLRTRRPWCRQRGKHTWLCARLDILILSLGGLRPWHGHLPLKDGAQLVGVYKVKEAPNEGSSGWPQMPALVRRPKAEARRGPGSAGDGGSISGDRKLKERAPRLAPGRPQPPAMGFDD